MSATQLATHAEAGVIASSEYIDVGQTAAVLAEALQPQKALEFAYGRVESWGRGIIAATVGNASEARPAAAGADFGCAPDSYEYIFVSRSRDLCTSKKRYADLLACAFDSLAGDLREALDASYGFVCVEQRWRWIEDVIFEGRTQIDVPAVYIHTNFGDRRLGPLKLQRHYNHLPHHRRLQNLAAHWLQLT